MKYFVLILCFVCFMVKNGTSLSIDDSQASKFSENVDQEKNKPEDLEGSETIGKLFSLKGILPTYNQYPTYSSGYYPSSSGSYYPSSSGSYYPSSSGSYYPSSGSYYPSSGSYYPSSSGGFYPSTSGSYYPSSSGSYYPSSSGSYYPTYKPYSGYWPSVSGGSSGFYPSTGTNILGHGSGNYPGQSNYPSSSYRTSSDSSNGGYGGYGGNGGLTSYNGYNNPRYNGKRNLGFGYQADTDRYGFYKSPSKELSVYRGYDYY